MEDGGLFSCHATMMVSASPPEEHHSLLGQHKSREALLGGVSSKTLLKRFHCQLLMHRLHSARKSLLFFARAAVVILLCEYFSLCSGGGGVN